MATREFETITRFLTEHQPAIAALFEHAYAQVGGHYTTLTPEQRHAQAQQDSRQLITDLLRGGPDRAAIRHTVATASDPSIPADVVRLAGLMERLFMAFVQERLADQPASAQVLIERADLVFARFRLGLSSAIIEQRAAGTNGHPSQPHGQPAALHTNTPPNTPRR